MEQNVTDIKKKEKTHFGNIKMFGHFGNQNKQQNAL